MLLILILWLIVLSVVIEVLRIYTLVTRRNQGHTNCPNPLSYSDTLTEVIKVSISLSMSLCQYKSACSAHVFSPFLDLPQRNINYFKPKGFTYSTNTPVTIRQSRFDSI